MTGLQRHGFPGRIVPVNPERDGDRRAALRADIAAAAADEPIDLAVVSLPQTQGPDRRSRSAPRPASAER